MPGTLNWYPQHGDPLFILAMDHRESFGRTLFGVEQFGRLAQVSTGLRGIGVPLLYELLVPATDAQLGQAGQDTAAYDRDILPYTLSAGAAVGRPAGRR